MSKLPLPDGWIEKYDPIHQHNYWVDTRTIPPRATWVHPYGDDQSFERHPDIDQRPNRKSSEPPPYREKPERRHSFDGGCLYPPLSRTEFAGHSAEDVNAHSQDRRRGFFGRLKDKVIGTKEEREERRRMEQAERERYANMLLRASYLRQQQYRGNAPYHRSYWACTPANAYPVTYAPPPGPPTPHGLSRGLGPEMLVGGTSGAW
ncbi:hypothetical protein ID866_1175 [Astraeus odoratus]|nr:hypothetical protein ID866_1175 [Astraeus odoratus]